MAGELGFEPRQTESESVVLPLHHSPKIAERSQNLKTPPAVRAREFVISRRLTVLLAARDGLWQARREVTEGPIPTDPGNADIIAEKGATANQGNGTTGRRPAERVDGQSQHSTISDALCVHAVCFSNSSTPEPRALMVTLSQACHRPKIVNTASSVSLALLSRHRRPVVIGRNRCAASKPRCGR